MKILELKKIFIKSQDEYINNTPMDIRKKAAQYFTPEYVINKMISTIKMSYLGNLHTLSILEPSAGCGILILYLVIYLLKNNQLQNIDITAYENDVHLVKILNKNLSTLSDYITNSTKITFNYKIIYKNFLLDHIKGGFDIIISNPPFKKIRKTSKEALLFSKYLYGQPNMYMLFIIASLKLLNKNGVYAVLSPKNYLSGNYAQKIRSSILKKNFSLIHIHTFDNREIFKDICQEIIISTYINNPNYRYVTISHNGHFSTRLHFNNIIQSNNVVLVPRNTTDLRNITTPAIFKTHLNDLNLKISVGPVVQFRLSKYLNKNHYNQNYAPLLLASNLKENNSIKYNELLNDKKNHSLDVLSSKVMNNSNYVILQKATRKMANPFVKAAVLTKDFFNHKYIAFDNSLLYIKHKTNNVDLSLEECYGLYCYLTSSYFSTIFNLINSNHTINISDFNNVCFPNKKQIIDIGKKMIKSHIYNQKFCDSIINNYH